jgi:hypothetical protein
MGPTTINGLPAHILLVHAVVVLVPLTSLVLVACVIKTSWIARLGLLLPALALITLVSVPLATHAGEWLERHTDGDPLVRKHAELGDTLLPWVLGLFVVTIAAWWFGRNSRPASATAPEPGRQGGTTAMSVPVHIAAIALSLLVATGSVVQVYRIGDSGSKAAWHDGYSAEPVTHNGH